MGDGKVRVPQTDEDGYEVIEVNTPCVLTCVKELNEPRYMSVGAIVDAYKKDIQIWDHRDVELDPQDCGLNASPTQVFRSFTPSPEGKGRDALRNRRRYGRNAGGKISGKAFSLTGCRKRPEYIRWVPAACIALKRQKYSL